MRYRTGGGDMNMDGRDGSDGYIPGPSVTEPARAVPVWGDWDVVVCGAGPAGWVAAVAAARSGARTALVDQLGFPGGMATAGLVGPMCKFRFRGERIVGGIPWEFVTRLSTRGEAIDNWPSGNVPFDAEAYKVAAHELLCEAGVDLLWHAKVCGCLGEGEPPTRLTHVLVETRGGRYALAGRIFIDATGVGDLVARTGLPWRQRAAANELQPMSLCSRLGGVDTKAWQTQMRDDGVRYRSLELGALLAEEVAAGRLKNFGGPWAVHGSTLRPGEVTVNATRYAGNAVEPRDLADAESSLRQDVPVIVQAFRRHPAFRDAYLISTATQVGIREARGIEGLHTLTAADLLAPELLEDTVALGGHPIDLHLPGSSGQQVRFLERPYGIPYRALVPRDSSNLLAAGGCIAADRQAFASVRVQAQCMAMGQAAGTAAALCVATGLSVAELPTGELRQALQRADAVVRCAGADSPGERGPHQQCPLPSGAVPHRPPRGDK